MYRSFNLENMWRVVITKTYPDGRSYTVRRGPFKSKGAVTTAVNREKVGWETDRPAITATYQRAQLHWEDVETR